MRSLSRTDIVLGLTGLGTIVFALWLSGQDYSRKDVIIGLATNYVVAVVFYFLLVWLPERRRRRRIKASLIAHYQQFKLDVIGLILHAAGKAWSQEDRERLVIPKEFSAYFTEDETGSGMRWYEVLNGLNDYYVSQIAIHLELLRSEVQFVLSSINIEEQGVFEFMKRLSGICYQMSKLKADYDDQKALGRFLWSLYADFDPIVGDVPKDQNLELFERI